MTAKSLFLSILASTVVASPLAIRDYPPFSDSLGFTMVANVTDLSKDWTPSINHWSLSGAHFSSSYLTAVVQPSKGQFFIRNGTAPEIHTDNTNILSQTDDVPGYNIYPLGLVFEPRNDAEGDFIHMSISVTSPGTKHAGVLAGLRSPYPIVFGPTGTQFMVCHEEPAVPPHNPYAVRGVVDGNVPADCVPITLLPQCTQAPALIHPDALNLQLEHVSCYEDVASIDWSKYSNTGPV